MNQSIAGNGETALAARPQRVERETAAARRLLASGTSEIEEVLGAVADGLARDIREQGERPGAVEETAPGSAPSRAV